MPDMGTAGPFPAKSRHLNSCVGGVSFTLNGAANPTLVIDTGNILSRSTPPTYVAVGIIRLTLRERWVAIVPHAQYSNAAQQCMPVAVTEGHGQDNVVDILVHIGCAAQVPTAAPNIMRVSFDLVRG